ncbi:MAG: bifunctional riboflavin kinase/FAD synthetase [Cocleimonas sp.]
MKLIRGLNSIKLDNGLHNKGCVATIGNFDGLHLGHKKIIDKLKLKAELLDLPLTVISFEPLPAEFFMPEPPARIFPLRDKVRLLNTLGVDNFLCLKFDTAFAAIPAEDFVRHILLDKLNVKYLAVGDDFRFGHQRKGDVRLLKTIGEKSGMEVTDTPTCEQDRQRISSTRIRDYLAVGDMAAANKLLGHAYQLSGRIRHGDKRGRTIGFPTLNLRVLDHIAPARGVYAVRVKGLAKGTLKGVANLGSRPTVNGVENRLETHLFAFEDDTYEAYGKNISVELVTFIRAEKRFDDFEALKMQILKDAEKAREILDQ